MNPISRKKEKGDEAQIHNVNELAFGQIEEANIKTHSAKIVSKGFQLPLKFAVK